MRERLIALRERRARLIVRAEAEREALVRWLMRAEAASAWLEKGVRLIAEVRRRPLWAAAALAVLVVLRPKRALKWLAGGWSLWRIYRIARTWLRDLVTASEPDLRRRRA